MVSGKTPLSGLQMASLLTNGSYGGKNISYIASLLKGALITHMRPIHLLSNYLLKPYLQIPHAEEWGFNISTFGILNKR